MLKRRQAVQYVYLCLVNLFDKAVAEGARPNAVKTRSKPYDET